jgi:predicted nucleic acid-binding protein
MIISNATPLIAFGRIGQLSLLPKVVERLVILRAVAHEISDYTCDRKGVIDLQLSSFFPLQIAV